MARAVRYFCGYLLLSLLLIYTNDSLYAIALANGQRWLYPVRLANRDQLATMLIPENFLYFVFSSRNHKSGLYDEYIVD